MQPLAGALCAVCGERIHGFAGSFAKESAAPASADGGDFDAQLCGLCRRAQPPFQRAVAFGAYEGVLRELLHLFKFEGVRSAEHILGQYAAQAASALPIADTLVVPVPLHVRRRRERGFNQAERIARAAARELRLPLVTGCLERTRWTESQIGLTRHQRRANLRGAFRVNKRNRGRIAGRDVLLMDDILTTGSTAAECARVLMRAGARQVFVATVARALKGETGKAGSGVIAEERFVSKSEIGSPASEIAIAPPAP